MKEYIDKQKLIDYLFSENELQSKYGYNKVEPIKPTHGSCCTCQTCGRNYDDCVCDHNDWIDRLESFTAKES